MNKEQFISLHEAISEQAMAIMLKTGGHSPTALIGKGDALYQYNLSGCKNAEQMESELLPACHSVGAEYLFIIIEAWMTNKNIDRPSQSPDRQEILLVTGEHKEFGQLSIFFHIHRKPDGSISDLLMDEQKVNDAQGRLAHLLTRSEHTSEFVRFKKQPGYAKYYSALGYTIH